MNIKREDSRLEKLKEIECALKESPENRLYVWGCSKTALTITRFCEDNSKVPIEAYVVDDLYYADKSFHNKPVYKVSEWNGLAKSGDYVIMGFTGDKRAKQIIERLPAGIQGFYFYFPYSANENGTYLTYEDFCRNEKRFLQVYDSLEDSVSRETLEAFINSCITGDVEHLERFLVKGQYFNDLTKDCKAGCFVDCGAYIGDTVEAAVEFYGDRLKKIIAFEPDENNIAQLNQRIANKKLPKDCLMLVAKGTWSQSDTLRFSSSNSSSSISAGGDLEICVDSLDHVLGNMDVPVDFIKMDVEGSEKETLLGAAHIIEKYHPLLAVCAYHRPEDLYTLPETIKALVNESDYRYYFRYHGPDLRELVFYAIPIK